MMNILLVTSIYESAYDANVNIVRNVAVQLAVQSKGICHILASENIGEELPAMQGIVLHKAEPYAPSTIVAHDPFLKSRFEKLQNKRFSFLRKILVLLAHPLRTLRLIASGAFTRVDGKIPAYALDYSENIKRICYQYSIDAILAVYMPQIVMQTVAWATFSKPVFLYQLDPWGLHQLPLPVEKSVRIEQETAAFAKAVHIFTTPVLLKQYEQDPHYRKYAAKMSSLDFPTLVLPEKSEGKCKGMLTTNGPDTICFLYSGTIADTYRSPAFFLNLVEILRDNGMESMVYFIGINQSDILSRYAIEHPAGIALLGPQPPKDAKQAMYEADVLVNIGNTLTNQMPSKVIDYIATGKPIVNICKSGACPTLHFMAKYPLCIHITEDEPPEDAAGRLYTFCRQYRGKVLDEKTILELYKTATPEYVAGQILEVMREVLQ